MNYIYGVKTDNNGYTTYCYNDELYKVIRELDSKVKVDVYKVPNGIDKKLYLEVIMEMNYDEVSVIYEGELV